MIRQSVLKLALAGAEHIVLINARLVQRNSRGIAEIRQHVKQLQATGVFHQEAVMDIATRHPALRVPKNSHGIVMIKQLVQALKEAGANQQGGLLMLQLPQADGAAIPVRHAGRTSRGIAAIKVLA